MEFTPDDYSNIKLKQLNMYFNVRKNNMFRVIISFTEDIIKELAINNNIEYQEYSNIEDKINIMSGFFDFVRNRICIDTEKVFISSPVFLSGNNMLIMKMSAKSNTTLMNFDKGNVDMTIVTGNFFEI